MQVGDFSYGFNMSWSNEFTFKAFRVSGLLDWARGGNTINLTDQYFDTGPYLGTDSLATVARNAGTNAGREMYVQPAGFLKVREITLSYNLPVSLVNRIGWRPRLKRTALSSPGTTCGPSSTTTASILKSAPSGTRRSGVATT